MLTTLSALAEPNRLRIVELLRTKPLAVGAIGDELELRQPQVSKHLKVLREAGLVTVEVRAQQRLYELRAEPFQELDQWLERYRAMWDARLGRLDDYLQTMKQTRKPKKTGDER